MSKKPMANIPPFGLRMQPDLKAKIEAASEASGRSMNAEIVARLENSFSSWPNVTLPPDLARRGLNASYDQRVSFINKLNAAAVELARHEFPFGSTNATAIIQYYQRILDNLDDAKREFYEDKLGQLLGELMKDLPEEVAREELKEFEVVEIFDEPEVKE